MQNFDTLTSLLNLKVAQDLLLFQFSVAAPDFEVVSSTCRYKHSYIWQVFYEHDRFSVQSKSHENFLDLPGMQQDHRSF